MGVRNAVRYDLDDEAKEVRRSDIRQGGDLRKRLHYIKPRPLFVQRRLLQVAERERQTIGRELHDALGQNLVGMALLADELSLVLVEQPGNNAIAVTKARRLGRLCRDTMATVRALARGLSPAGVPEGELCKALVELAVSSTTDSVVCRADCQPVRVPPETAEHLFRVAQEAVTNALKHSRCSSIVLSLTCDSDTIVLTVEDDGRGFTAAHLRGEGLGLRSMRHRCEILAGELTIENATPGTRVTVRCDARCVVTPEVSVPDSGTPTAGRSPL